MASRLSSARVQSNVFEASNFCLPHPALPPRRGPTFAETVFLRFAAVRPGRSERQLSALREECCTSKNHHSH